MENLCMFNYYWMTMVYSIGSAIGIGLLLWFNSKSGQRWLEAL